MAGWPVRALRRQLLVVCLILAAPLSPGLAQEPEAGAGPVPAILTLDQETFFRESAWGKAAIARAEAEGDALRAENRRIEEALQNEEQVLTERRAGMAPDEFSRLAAEFDARVEDIRTAQDTKSRAIVGQMETDQQSFFTAARPVLEAILQESGAAAILSSGAVLIPAHFADITTEAIARMDATYPGLPPQSPQAPEPSGAPEAPAP